MGANSRSKEWQRWQRCSGVHCQVPQALQRWATEKAELACRSAEEERDALAEELQELRIAQLRAARDTRLLDPPAAPAPAPDPAPDATGSEVGAPAGAGAGACGNTDRAGVTAERASDEVTPAGGEATERHGQRDEELRRCHETTAAAAAESDSLRARVAALEGQLAASGRRLLATLQPDPRAFALRVVPLAQP